jgi:hypothetical protein
MNTQSKHYVESQALLLREASLSPNYYTSREAHNKLEALIAAHNLNMYHLLETYKRQRYEFNVPADFYQFFTNIVIGIDIVCLYEQNLIVKENGGFFTISLDIYPPTYDLIIEAYNLLKAIYEKKKEVLKLAICHYHDFYETGAHNRDHDRDNELSKVIESCSAEDFKLSQKWIELLDLYE